MNGRRIYHSVALVALVRQTLARMDTSQTYTDGGMICTFGRLNHNLVGDWWFHPMRMDIAWIGSSQTESNVSLRARASKLAVYDAADWHL